MVLLYIAVGGILGFISYGIVGALFGIGLGFAFSVSQKAEKRMNELENEIQLLEAKLNDEVITLKAKAGQEK